VDDRPGHDKRYAVDSTKLKNTLKWKPRESFQSGIKKTIKWYLNNEDWWRKIQKNNYNQKRLGLKNK
jgi:dTDP-glucose 4,6-dehydratase